jgi:hypothetical protein
LKDALRPQAPAAGGEAVPKAILFVGFRHLASAAVRTGSKVKSTNAIAKRPVIRILPQVLEVSLPDIADDVAVG